MTVKALVCGSFDPVTLGHLDIIARASRMFGDVTVGVFCNSEKRYLFSAEERAAMIREACEAYALLNVEVAISEGMVAHYMQENGIGVLVKGVRNAQDLEYERMLERANKLVCKDIETVLLLASPELAHISSTVVREFIKYGEKIGTLVPESVLKRIKQ